MTTATRVTPQLRLGEQILEDEHLQTLLAEREAAKIAYDDAKGYVEDYLNLHELAAGEYRIGPFRLKFGTRRTVSVTVPKK